MLDKDPDPLGLLAPQHRALEPVVHRLLAKRASDRYASATELSEALTVRNVPGFSERLRRLFRAP